MLLPFIRIGCFESRRCPKNQERNLGLVKAVDPSKIFTNFVNEVLQRASEEKLSEGRQLSSAKIAVSSRILKGSWIILVET